MSALKFHSLFEVEITPCFQNSMFSQMHHSCFISQIYHQTIGRFEIYIQTETTSRNPLLRKKGDKSCLIMFRVRLISYCLGKRKSEHQQAGISLSSIKKKNNLH